MNQQNFRKATMDFIEKEGPEAAIKTMAQMLGRMAVGLGSGFEIDEDDEGWLVEVSINADSDDED